MAQIQFSDEEAHVLKELLRHKLTDLEVEIHRTDRLEFKEQLKHRHRLLTNIYERLPGESDVTPQI